jgi:hypothetical protein
MIKRIYKPSLVVIAVLAGAAAFIGPAKIPLGVVAGGVLALVNFGGMHRGLENLLGTERPTAKLVVLSIFRLTIVSAVIIALAVLRAVDLIGLAAGFTAVVLVLVVEGYRTALKEKRKDVEA